jgi:origin recognition complex subunit 1
MLHSTDLANSRKRVSRAEQARRYLSGSGVAREDSDDELGLEDLPWEWIYGDRHQSRGDAHNNAADEFEVATTSLNPSRKRKGRYESLPGSEWEIVGARMGSFECRVGDCVLLKAEGNNEAWVGLICEFMEDEDEDKVANFMWFSTEKEIRNKEKKRTDFMQVF